MNTYLMMSAAALLATTAAGSAEATTFSVHYGTSGGFSYCDGLKGHDISGFYVASHVFTTCGYSMNFPMLGLAEKTKPHPVGKNSVNFFIPNNPKGENELYSMDVEIPIKAGGKWDLWTCFQGSCFFENSGILLAGPYPKVPGKQAPSVISKLAEVTASTR